VLLDLEAVLTPEETSAAFSTTDTALEPATTEGQAV